MLLADLNVLLYAVDERAARHEQARGWLDSAIASGVTVGLPWVVLLDLLRLSTSASVFPRPLAPGQALAVTDSWLAQPGVVALEPGPRHLAILAGLLREAGTAGNLVTDAHLAALALEHDLELVSYDADFGRFAGLRWSAPSR